MDYYYQLKYSPADDDWCSVMDALAIQETYFWREIDQLRTVVDHLVPGLAAAHRGSPLRIWTAACATGEEPLTIAMLLTEAGRFARAPIEIVATDASPAAVTRARAGALRATLISQPAGGLAREVLRAQGRPLGGDSRAAAQGLLRHRQPDGRG
jgi:chemotaxis protein methyltransferase CheR